MAESSSEAQIDNMESAEKNVVEPIVENNTDSKSATEKLVSLGNDDSFEKYEAIRAESGNTAVSDWDIPQQKESKAVDKDAKNTNDTKSSKGDKPSTESEADNAKETKGSDDPEKGETSDDDDAGLADKGDQKNRGERNPRWVNRRVNKAVKSAVSPLNDKIQELESKILALGNTDSNRSEKKQESSEQPGSEPDIDDYDDNPEQYVSDLTAWEKKVEAFDSKASEQSDLDKGQENRQESKSNEAHANDMQGTVSDIDQILDEKSPDIRDDFWEKVKEQKIAFPDAFLQYINDLADSDKISNLLQHFYHDPMKSRSIARTVGDVEKQQNMFIDLAETPFVAPVTENKGKSASKKAVNKAPNIEPIGAGKSEQDFDITDDNISFEQYEIVRSRQVLDDAYGGF